MIFFADNDGTITSSVPSPVYQGSANVNNIYLVAPFAVNSAVAVAFTLPNGVITERYLMTPIKELDGIVNKHTSEKYSVWTYSPDISILQRYGTVTVQFFFYGSQDGEITATSSTTFSVGKGVPSVLPTDNPPSDIYNKILNRLTYIQGEIDNSYQAGFADSMQVVTETLPEGEPARVEVTPVPETPPTAKAFKFDFYIPKGGRGYKGDKGVGIYTGILTTTTNIRVKKVGDAIPKIEDYVVVASSKVGSEYVGNIYIVRAVEVLSNDYNITIDQADLIGNIRGPEGAAINTLAIGVTVDYVTGEVISTTSLSALKSHSPSNTLIAVQLTFSEGDNSYILPCVSYLESPNHGAGDENYYDYIFSNGTHTVIILTCDDAHRNSVTYSEVIQLDIVQTTGTSETAVMSQKAVTNEFNKINESQTITKNELADLKEALYGYVLDTTEIETEGVIPSTVDISGTTYNLVDNVRGLVKEIKGGTVKSENLLVLTDVPETTINGITYSIKDGVIKINGTATEITDIVLKRISIDYTTTFKLFKSSPNDNVTLRMWNKDFTTDSGEQIDYSTSNTLGQIIIRALKDGTFDNLVVKPMLVQGSTAPKEFKPGFKGLKSVEYTGLKVRSKNLLNISDVPTTTENGITYYVKDGVLNLNGTSTADTLLHFGKVSVKLNDTFTIKTFNSNVYFQWSLSHDNIWLLTSAPFQDSITFKITNENANTLELLVYIINGESISNQICKPMLVSGSTAPTEFKPYRADQTLLQYTTTLRGVNDVKDKILITKNKNDNYYTAKKISNISNPITLNGSETWSIEETNNNEKPRFRNIINYLTFSKDIEKITSVSTYIDKSALDTYKCNNGFSIDTNWVLVYVDGITTVDDFKTWITTNPITFVGQLATPTTEVLSTTLTDYDVMPLLELGGMVEIINDNSFYVTGSSVLEMVYKVINV